MDSSSNLDAAGPRVRTVDDQFDVASHVQRILDSPSFVRADTQRKLLTYLWASKDAELSEYAIATEALGRRDDFDSKSDASVRVQVSRLRTKLRDYYDSHTDEPRIIDIPIGSHRLVVSFEERARGLQLKEPVISMRSSWSFLGAQAALLGFLLLGSSAWFLWHHTHVEAQSAYTAQPTRFWQAIAGNDAPVRMIISSPTFFSFSKAPTLRIRALEINDFDEMPNSVKFKNVTTNLGQPALEPVYNSSSDTLAAIDLSRYLDRVGLGHRLTTSVSGDIDLQDLESDNIIALGTRDTLRPFKPLLDQLNFYVDAPGYGVHNRRPLTGEEARYVGAPMGNKHRIEPSIVAVLPGRTRDRKILIVQSRYTAALVSMLTSNSGNQLLASLLKSKGDPEYFEFVTFTEMSGEQPLKSWPVVLHSFAPISADKQVAATH